MKLHLVFIIIFSILFNFAMLPLCQSADSACISAGMPFNAKADFFSNNFVFKMMQLSVDFVSSGKNTPTPLKKKSEKKTDSREAGVLVWSVPGFTELTSGMSGTIAASFTGIFDIKYDLERYALLSRVSLWLHLYILFSLMLVFLLPRGSIDDLIIINNTRVSFTPLH